MEQVGVELPAVSLSAAGRVATEWEWTAAAPRPPPSRLLLCSSFLSEC